MFACQTGLLEVEIWLEPFGGGLGAGLGLLHADAVDEVWFCEANPALRTLWAVMLRGRELVDWAADFRPTLDAFYAARDTVAQAAEGSADVEVAKAAFVLNRCSRSGMITPTVGPIGGKSQQGRYRVDSRWNGQALAERLDEVATLAARINFRHSDGVEYLAGLDGTVGIEEEIVAFADPPYMVAGRRLYAEAMNVDSHEKLAEVLQASPLRWLATYDAHPRVAELYAGRDVFTFHIAHAAGGRGGGRIGQECLVVSDNLRLPDRDDVVPRGQLRLTG